MSPLGRAYYSFCRGRAGHAAARVSIAGLRKVGLLRGFRMPLDALTLDHAAAAGLMRLWTRIHWSSGDGMMPPEQLLEVYRLATTWPVEGDIVELGAWVGLTTSYLATACQVRGRGMVHAVDTFAGTREGGTTYPSVERFGGSTLDAFHDQIARAGACDAVETLIGDTTEVAAAYAGGPIRLLLIDADHSYDGVRNDFASWWPHVAPGGLIVFHDYDMPEVARFIDREVRGDGRVDIAPGHTATNIMAVTKRTSPRERAAADSSRDTAAEPAMAAVL